MVKAITLFLASSFLLFSCAPATQASSQFPIVTVYATPAAQPWLAELFACADQRSVVLSVTASDPSIQLQIGEPRDLVSPSYQIDEEEILVVANRESPVQNLSLDQAQALFAGRGDASVQIWVYASDEDLQIAFDQLVMKGRHVSSSARLASDPQAMWSAINAEKNSIGILSLHSMTGDVREVYSAGTAPVLAIVQHEPDQLIHDLLRCVQNN